MHALEHFIGGRIGAVAGSFSGRFRVDSDVIRVIWTCMETYLMNTCSDLGIIGVKGQVWSHLEVEGRKE